MTTSSFRKTSPPATPPRRSSNSATARPSRSAPTPSSASTLSSSTRRKAPATKRCSVTRGVFRYVSRLCRRRPGHAGQDAGRLDGHSRLGRRRHRRPGGTGFPLSRRGQRDLHQHRRQQRAATRQCDRRALDDDRADGARRDARPGCRAGAAGHRAPPAAARRAGQPAGGRRGLAAGAPAPPISYPPPSSSGSRRAPARARRRRDAARAALPASSACWSKPIGSTCSRARRRRAHRSRTRSWRARPARVRTPQATLRRFTDQARAMHAGNVTARHRVRDPRCRPRGAVGRGDAPGHRRRGARQPVRRRADQPARHRILSRRRSRGAQPRARAERGAAGRQRPAVHPPNDDERRQSGGQRAQPDNRQRQQSGVQQRRQQGGGNIRQPPPQRPQSGPPQRQQKPQRERRDKKRDEQQQRCIRPPRRRLRARRKRYHTAISSSTPSTPITRNGDRPPCSSSGLPTTRIVARAISVGLCASAIHSPSRSARELELAVLVGAAGSGRMCAARPARRPAPRHPPSACRPGSRIAP